MISNKITLQLSQLKEKTKTYSAISRSYKTDEIRSDVAIINDEITGLNRDINNILVDGLGSKIEIENWFEGLMDRSKFIEPNPRLIYEEEQREIERQKKNAEEKRQRELEELQKRQKQERIDAFRKLLVYGPEDSQKVKDFIADGFNINDDLPEIGFNWLLNHGRSLQFIELLIDAGMKVTENDRFELERQRQIARDLEKQKLEAIGRQQELAKEKEKQRLEEIERQKKLAKEREKQQLEDIERQKKLAKEREKRQFEDIERQKRLRAEQNLRDAEEKQKRLQAQRIDEFKRMCQYGYADYTEDIPRLKKLIEEGLNINEIEDFDCLETSISWRKSLRFIQFLVDSSVLVTNKHIEYCYANKKYFKDAATLINLLENAKNLDSVAFENILKRTKFNVIGTISATCISIFLLFMPQMLNSEIDSFYYILVGIITVLFLLIAISFTVDLRKRLKINNTNHLIENQLPHSKQAGYERPNPQGEIGIAGSVKEFNNKKIKGRKLNLWIVVTWILVSIIVLIYIYFEEVIAFLKIMLILGVIVGLFIWRYSPTKRR